VSLAWPEPMMWTGVSVYFLASSGFVRMMQLAPSVMSEQS